MSEVRRQMTEIRVIDCGFQIVRYYYSMPCLGIAAKILITD